MNPNDATKQRVQNRVSAFLSCKVEGPIVSGDGTNRRHRLLLEFLQKKSSQHPSYTEESSSCRLAKEIRNQATFPHDVLFKTLILLPAESLFRLQFVCKKWFDLINNPVFMRCQAQQADTALICQNLTLLESGKHPFQSEAKPKAYFHFLDLNKGDNYFIESNTTELANIEASCDGLIIATVEKSKGVMLMNPMTRSHTVLPLSAVGDPIIESYGMAFCNDEKTYKVVHLFRDSAGQLGCEILSICTRKWRAIEAPPEILKGIFRATPVSVSGTLNWMPRRYFCDYIVSMKMQDEEFFTKKLPICGLRDMLIEIEGNLGFVTHGRNVTDAMQVWVLMEDGETWAKRYAINLNGDIGRTYPICSARNGKDIVLENLISQLCVYDSDRDEVRRIHSTDDEDDQEWSRRIGQLYIPHRNTIMSWEDFRFKNHAGSVDE